MMPNTQHPTHEQRPTGILGPLTQLGKRLLSGNQLEGLRLAATAWILARLVLLIWGAVLWRTHLIPAESVSQPADEARGSRGEARTLLVDVWKRWDAFHYEAILEEGYRERNLSVHFPLYPLLARVVGSLLSLPAIPALLLVSHVCSFLALLALYQVARRAMETAIARRSTAAAVLFPTSFFLFAPFTESLSLLLTLVTVWLVHERRWFAACLAGLAAGLSRPTVLPLAALIGWAAIQDWSSRGWAARITRLLVAATPILGTAAFLAWRTSVGLPSIESLQAEAWGRTMRWPWQTLLDIPRWISSGSFTLASWAGLAILLLMLIAVVWGWRKLPMGWNLYQVSLLLLLTVSERDLEPLTAIPRYALLMFPLYAVLALWAHTPRRRLVAVTAGFASQLLLSGQFFMGGWIG